MARIKRAVNGRHRRKVAKLVVRAAAAGTIAWPTRLCCTPGLFVSRSARPQAGFSPLWIARINAAARREGLSYSRFMAGLKRAGST